nr:MAG: MazF-like toxin [Bacteriophage sp.]
MSDTIISDLDRANLDLLDLTIRNIRIDGNKIEWSKKDNSYKPVLKKGDIVQCEFTGLGREMKLGHFAIVWSAKANSESINVIPLTSKPKEESKGMFSLGNIDGFYTKEGNNFINKESFVYLNKLMEVSRKRIKPKYKQDCKGKFKQNPDNSYVQLSIDSSKIKRIEEGFRLFYLEEGKCLVDIMMKEIHINYQIDINSIDIDILKLGYRLIESYAIYEINLNKLIVCHINGKRYSILLKEIKEDQIKKYNKNQHKNLYKKIEWKKNIRAVRNKIIEALFSNEKNKVDEAQKILIELWK